MAEARVDDPFEVYDGLPDDFDGTIVGAYFGYDTEYAGGDKCALMFTLESPDLEGPEKMRFGTGKDWKPDKTPRGKSIDRVGTHRFHKNSGCGVLLVAMKEAGALDALAATKLTPMDAGLYEGLTFHWERREYTFDMEDGKGVQTSSRLTPTKYIGTAASAKAEAKAPKQTKAEKLAAAEAAAADDVEAEAPAANTEDASALIEGLTTKQRGKLSVKAMAAASVEEFVDAVKDLDIVPLDVLMAIASTLFTEANAED